MAEYEGRKKYLEQVSDVDDPECGTCLHFAAHEDDDLNEQEGHGKCLRFPPPNAEGIHPEMMHWQKCGEWKVNRYVEGIAQCNSLAYLMPEEIWEVIEKKTKEHREEVGHFISYFLVDDEFSGLFDIVEKSWIVHALLGMSRGLEDEFGQVVVHETKAYREENCDQFADY